jgi:cysteinyl-tRNA synthetase
MQEKMKVFIEDILGLQSMAANDNNTLDGVMQLLIDIRKEAKAKKDYATSDKIRNQLGSIGIALKDEKDGTVSWDMG